MYYNFSAKRDDWREFFIRYQDRILYGTDISGGQPVTEARSRAWIVRSFLETDEEFLVPKESDSLLGGPQVPFRGLALPRGVLEKIYSKNFRRLAGPGPHKLNYDRAISECKRIAETAGKNGVKPEENSAAQIASILADRAGGLP